MAVRLYARVSTADKGQDPDTQLEPLRRAEPGAIEYVDQASAVKKRPAWQRLMSDAVAGDTIVCWKLDRCFRSLTDAANIMQEFERRGINFRALTEGWDTKSPTGRLLYGILAVVAAFERDLLRERTRAGMARAMAHGARPGWRIGRKRQGQRGRAAE